MRQRRNKRKLSNDLYENLKILSKILTVLIIICLIIFIYSSIKVKKSFLNSDGGNPLDIAQTDESKNNDENSLNNEEFEFNESNNLQQEIPTSKPSDISIDMAITGDIMCHNTIFKDALNSTTKKYDFSYIFDDIKYHIQVADIAIGNLETTFAGSDKGYSGYPTFNTPESLAYNLKKVGFDVVSTANNHCYDKGYAGVESTINYLDDADIAHTGTFKSEESQNTILVKNVRGIQIAFLSFTYGTNGIPVPTDKSYSVNLINDENLIKQLALAKNSNPDLICVSMHWGVEYQTTPNDEQKRLADLLFNNGADIIIGNHPHVLQPMEKREITLADGTTKDGFIVYSLGNFLSDQNKQYTRDSAILNLNITKNVDGKISINTATYTPIYTYKKATTPSQAFKILDLKNTLASYESGYDLSIGKKLYTTLSTELKNVQNILGNEIR